MEVTEPLLRNHLNILPDWLADEIVLWWKRQPGDFPSLTEVFRHWSIAVQLI